MTPVSKTIVGAISGKPVYLPDVNKPPMPSVAASGIVKNGKSLLGFKLVNTPGQPDGRSYKRKFGLLIPATNTSMEHELWSIIFNNQEAGALDGVGIHTVNIQTPKTRLETEEDLLVYKEQFISGLSLAIEQAALAQPEYLIIGMSLEHILYGIDEIRSLMNRIACDYSYSFASWHDAADAALKRYNAKRVGIITPFDKRGNENATRMFEDLGYDVAASFGFACANALDIAHIPDTAKEEAIIKHLAIPENKLDAIVQCGTNMSMIKVAENLESRIGIPVLGINAVIFWYALRENGFQNPLVRAGRLLTEF